MLDFEKLMEKGLINNVLCYDDDAQPKEFTWHLYCVMCTVMVKIFHDELINIYIESDIDDTTNTRYVKCEIQDGLTKLFSIDKDAVIYPPKTRIVLGVGKNGNVILGCC